MNTYIIITTILVAFGAFAFKIIWDHYSKTLGYELDAVLIRDLMPAGDLKRVLTQVMTAKQESLAGL